MAQLVARYLGVVEAASSSLVTQTRRRFAGISSFLFFPLVFSLFRVFKLLTALSNRSQKGARYPDCDPNCSQIIFLLFSKRWIFSKNQVQSATFSSRYTKKRWAFLLTALIFESAHKVFYSLFYLVAFSSDCPGTVIVIGCDIILGQVALRIKFINTTGSESLPISCHSALRSY